MRDVIDEAESAALVPANQRREADDERQHPDADDEQARPARRHDGRVLDRATDGDVAVEADGAQVEDGSGAQPDVDCQPDATPQCAERPVA